MRNSLPVRAGGSGKVAPLSDAQIRASKKARELLLKGKGGFFGRKAPEYEIDETETDGYICKNTIPHTT